MLRMTKQADYGLVLMTHLANEGDRRFTAAELASETRIPSPMVSKILKVLGRRGLLKSHRGVKGGYSLDRDPRQISVAAVISALEGPIGFTECADDTPGSCTREAVCRLRVSWQRINLTLRRALEDISLAELIQPSPSPSLVQLGGDRSIGHRIERQHWGEA
ncbi:MAG: SUF system Fe-S cluster assembly regulator [bacterium]|nr:SUF system Fe-S cluster assembly regulator [bacterium]